MKKLLRAVTYCCIHKIQPNIDKQESELVAHAQELHLAIVANYSDNTPAYKLEERLQLNELIKAAIRKEFDCVLIYKFTSLAASIPHLLNVLKQFPIAFSSSVLISSFKLSFQEWRFKNCFIFGNKNSLFNYFYQSVIRKIVDKFSWLARYDLT